jgi:ATP-dependent Clp protease ATP-binding subunit ClpA
MARASFSDLELSNFLNGRLDMGSTLTISGGKIIMLKDLAGTLFDDNADFAKLLSSKGLKKGDWLNIVEWVADGIGAEELSLRWWRRENLDRLGSIGRGWSFGGTYTLDLYARDLLEAPESNFSSYEIFFRDKEVRQIESVLSRSNEMNVLLIGMTGPVRMDVLWTFVKEVKNNLILPVLEHKRILLFNTSLFVSAFKERSAFENQIINVFNEAVKAGDIILVIDDFAGFLTEALSLQSNVFSILDQYFSSSSLQVIAMVDTDKFHHLIETRPDIMSRFEKVQIEDLTEDQVVMTLIEEIDHIEKRYPIKFTYQALFTIVKSAESYFSEGALSEKAKDLLTELIPWALKQKKYLLSDKEVEDYVRAKTNIPIGEITPAEKTKLMNLEQDLAARVIGQDQAVKAVAGAMMRSRAGTRNTNRPIGSFLFLGPTGVGKTETAKALAATYFGDETKLMRLDMTEYQAADSMNRLIGSFADNKPGVLTSMIRQNQFGVLLLDEFEKTNTEVLNLFLQILDEGKFADMEGKPVNARNIIFIATSNAGADKIWELVGQGDDPVAHRDELINDIVSSGIFKPELLNRFDEVVIFHPLVPDVLKSVSALMLKKLAERLQYKGIELIVNDYLINLVSSEGANKIFGARPMNRYIQENIEQAIAGKIVAGEVKAGSRVEFIPAEQPLAAGNGTVMVSGNNFEMKISG